MQIRPADQQRVLHILGSAAPWDEPMTRVLRTCELEAEQSFDVYRGLARLGRNCSEGLATCVVCVDELCEEEFEFFALAGRFGFGHRVLVYSNRNAVGRMRQAVDRGATECVEADHRSLQRSLGYSSASEDA